MAENATSHDEQQRGNINSISVLTFGRVRDVIESSLVLLVADHSFHQDPEHLLFDQNPANTLPYRALAEFQNAAIVHVAEVLQQKIIQVSPSIRRKLELRNHRDALSHPVEVQWRRADMREFSENYRKYADIRAALVWDMHRSINEELQRTGQTTRMETIEVNASHAIVLGAILRLSAKPGVRIPSDTEVMESLQEFLPEYMNYLEQHPDGVRSTTG
ncbi:MAG TPA: hypothetical protein VFC29_23020 [Candidatus Limnocylindrales bacterium]|nr:hypothetical protein [Candidatus Limnocylindrales bacterium]